MTLTDLLVKKMADYTKEQLEEAKEYLRRRLDSESSMRDDIGDVLLFYIMLLVMLLVSGESEERINETLDELVMMILEDCDTLAVDEHTDESAAILLFIHGEIGGKTLDDRIRERVGTLFDELKTTVMIGLLLKMSADAIVSAFVKGMKDPWNNSIIVEYRSKVASGEISPDADIDAEPRHYGKGVPVSSYTALSDIAVYAVSAGWSVYDYLSNRDSVGYHVFRGSSYPCDECDSHVGYHDISDTESLPLFHNHCKCYVVWVR